MTQLTLTVNGEERCLDVPPSRYLAEVLRYDLGLTGTKIGCDEAECGCCTVIVDGQSVDSCIYPAFKAQGAQVLTIEGLAQTREGCEDESCDALELHPLQDAFIRHGATQCGFCTPGFIMQAKTLLDENPDPSEVEIKECLKDTYCRCTGYTAIISSVKAASEYLRTGRMPDAVLPPVMKPLTQIGQPLQRPDAVDKVTGAALYTDDYTFDGMLFGATLRSEHPHARIRGIDADAARALEGVHAVLTHDDVPGDPRHGLVENDWPVFAGGRYPARYVGDAIALAVAETAEIAQQALALIDVDYEVLEAVTDPRDALQPDAPQLHPDRPDGNLLKHIKVRHGDVEAGFAASDVVVERTYRTPMTEHAFLEPECALAVPAGYSGVRPSTSKEKGAAEYDSDKLTVYVGSQIPYSDRRQVAKSLGLDDEEVRVIGTLMGGGFGGKEDIAGQIHAALAAQVTGRPVKILYSRQESLIFHPKRHSTIIRIKTGALRDGTLVAVEAELYGDSGAYASLGEKVMTRATTHATGPYVMPHARIDCYAMYTNNAPSGAFRGFGVTQSAFAVESNLDILAAELGMDPAELRRKNVMRVGVETATGQELIESVGLLECLDKVEDEIKRSEAAGPSWSPSDPWAPVQVGTKRYAWGIAAGYKNTGLGGGAPDKAEAEVEVFPDGTAAIRTSSAEMGQNLVGVLAACTAQELGLPFEKVHVTVMDTDLTPDGGPSTASRQTYVSGNAARLAARAMREQMQNVLAEKFDTHPEVIAFHEGLAYVDERRLAKMHGAELPVEGANGTNGSAGGILPGSTRSISFADAVNALLAENRLPKIRYEYWAPQTQPLGTGGDMHFAFSYAVHAAQVSVDTDTGEVAVERVISAHDVGRAINPLSLLGQIEGGIVMGIGNALTENYIVEDGVPWTERLGQYKMPGIKMTPKMDSHIVEHPTADGPYGAKGVGEISSIPISPAITNAICNAVGVRCLALPVDQDALLLAMRDGEREIDGHWGQTGEWLVVSGQRRH
ncbi:MAG: molybdopterin-dependent oxidoreductase [Caldilineaceae bacterium SB0668_bin_21]|nr:molybdopterin-dependent oxidoreductase [Caldilineaceae bacterium SB0668_bin_21]MYC21417.1 molybdopterin-dependent oxidoreductase [Caldilineaceae bacterium SB0662_bin_25]